MVLIGLSAGVELCYRKRPTLEFFVRLPEKVMVDEEGTSAREKHSVWPIKYLLLTLGVA